MSNHTTNWTQGMIDQLCRLRAEGLSSREIADVLGAGITRNAVIGKVHRLGLPPVGEKERKKRQKRASPKPRQIAATDTGAVRITMSNHRVYRVAQPKALPADKPLPIIECAPVGPVAYLDRALDQCAAIVSEDREPVFCCARPVGVNMHGQPSSYCQEHHNRYLVKPAQWKRDRDRARVSA